MIMQRSWLGVCLGAIGLMAACALPGGEPSSPVAEAAAPPPADLPKRRNICIYGELEFLQPQRIVAIEEVAGEVFVVSLEQSARYFAAEPSTMLRPNRVTAASLREMMASGAPVYASVALENLVEVSGVGVWPALTRIAPTPDPWSLR